MTQIDDSLFDFDESSVEGNVAGRWITFIDIVDDKDTIVRGDLE